MSELKLTDREWGLFYFNDLFESTFIAQSSDSNHLNNGDTPFVGRSSQNNGFQGLYQVSNTKINAKNSITVSMVGEPKAFYQPYNFTCSQNILILQHKSLNQFNAKFLCSIINKFLLLKGYGYGYPVGLGRIKKSPLYIPINSHKLPDWQFMEDYIKQIEQKQKTDLINYYSNKLLEIIGDTNYQDVQWDYFEIGKLFDFINKPSKGLNHLSLSERGTNYIGATNRNNGVLEYVENNDKLTYDGNAIVFIRNGEGAMGYSVYKKEKFIATQDVSVGYNPNLTEYSGLFITTIADKIRGKYNFGYKRSQSRLNKEKLRLPIDKNGNPNWQFMEDFIKNIEKDKIETLLSYLNQHNVLAEPSRAEPSRAEPSRAEPSRAEPSRAEIVWANFKLSQIFFIKSGVRLTKSEMTRGDMPFIGATEFNNGITEFVGNTNASLDKNILGVNYNGSVVENFYHPYACIFSDDVKRLELKNKDYANQWVYLFLKTIILQQKEKYQYGYKFNAQRMQKQTIMLPTDDKGEPNWAYMESVMKTVEIKKVLQILQHYEH